MENTNPVYNFNVLDNIRSLIPDNMIRMNQGIFIDQITKEIIDTFVFTNQNSIEISNVIDRKECDKRIRLFFEKKLKGNIDYVFINNIDGNNNIYYIMKNIGLSVSINYCLTATNNNMLVMKWATDNETLFNSFYKEVEEYFDDVRIKAIVNMAYAGISWYYWQKDKAEYFDITEKIDDIFYNEAYPYITDIDERIDNYLDSDESILLLIGKPGTGKTRFNRKIISKIFFRKLKEYSNNHKIYTSDDIIEHMGYPNIYYTTSSEIMNDDEMFLDFITSSSPLMILEDIDFDLRPRDEGNTSMYKLLNTSDGLIKSNKKKIIISTNIEINENGFGSSDNERLSSKIDNALLREGRCYDKFRFRPLTYNESVNFYKVINFENYEEFIKDNKTYTLAQLYYFMNNNKIKKMMS